MPGTTAHDSPLKRKLLTLYRAFIGTAPTIEGPDDSKARNNKHNCNTTEYSREGEPGKFANEMKLLYIQNHGMGCGEDSWGTQSRWPH